MATVSGGGVGRLSIQVNKTWAKVLSVVALMGLVFVGAMPVDEAQANGTDTPTNLGSVVVDCSEGNLRDFSISFSGGVGDFFVLINSGDPTNDDPASCSIPSNSVVTGPTTLAGNATGTFTVLTEGSFAVTGGGVTATATVVAHPIFANQATPASGQVVDFTCDPNSSRYVSRVIYFTNVDDTVVIQNGSSSWSCELTLGSVATASSTTLATAGSLTLTIKQAASISLEGQITVDGFQFEGPELTFTFVQGGPRGDVSLGASAAINDAINYSQVFHSGDSTYDATVTLTGAPNLTTGSTDNGVNNRIEFVDENLNPGEPNWSLSPKIRVQRAFNDGSASLAVAFTENGEPATLSGLSVTIVDIDALQYVEVDPNDLVSYELSTVPPPPS